MRLRVGLVGLGDTWPERHAPALRALAAQFKVRAVCDQVVHRAQQAATEFSAVAVDSYRALVRREDLDAVLILSPQWFGPLPILAASESGKAVYCAGGLDLQPEEAASVKQRVEQAGIAFMPEFPRRHAPATLRLKELIATRLSDARLIFCHRRAGAEDDRGHAPADWPERGNMHDLIELVDWCCYVVDREPTMVTGMMHQSDGRSPGEDYRMMSLDFSEPAAPGAGPVAQISCGRYIPARWEEAISFRPLAALQVCCERGVAFIDLPSTLIWFDEAGRHQESLDSERPVGEQMLLQFHRAATGAACKTCGLADAHRAITIVQLARRSHLEGRRIELEKGDRRAFLGDD